MSTLKSMSSPQQLLNMMAQKDPRVASIIKEVNSSGGDAKGLFYQKAQQMGVDPNVILDQLKDLR